MYANQSMPITGISYAQQSQNYTNVEMSVLDNNVEQDKNQSQYDTLNLSSSRNSLSEQMPYTTLTKQKSIPECRSPIGKRHICLALIALVLTVGVIITCLLVPNLLAVKRIEMKLDTLQNSNVSIKDAEPSSPAEPQECKENLKIFEPTLRLVYDNACFCLYTQQLTWFEARSFCLSQGDNVHLAEILQNATNAFLEPILVAFAPRIWIGASDVEVEGLIKWNFSNTLVETFNPKQWGQNEPNDFGGVEDCVELRQNLGWNDQSCEDRLAFLCQLTLSDKNRCNC